MAKCHPNRRRVTDAFQARYVEATGGHKPTWGPAELAVADRLARSHPIEEIEDRFRRCFGERVPAFIWKDGETPGIKLVASVFDSLVPVVASREFRRIPDAPRF